MPVGVGRNLRHPMLLRTEAFGLVSPAPNCFTHRQHLRRRRTPDVCSLKHTFASRVRSRVLGYMREKHGKPQPKTAGKPMPNWHSTPRRFLIRRVWLARLRSSRKGNDLFAGRPRQAGAVRSEGGGVRLSVVNETGKEAVVAVLGPGDFFGEGCLAGQRFGSGRRPPLRRPRPS